MKKKFVPNNNNCAIGYYRYSSASQNEASIEQQREAAHKYAEEHGYRIIDEYEDPAISGTTDNRPGLKKMLKEIKHLKPATLIMWKMDRLAREQAIFAVAKNVIREAGTKISYVADISVDDSPAGRLVEHIWESMAEFYSDNLAENIRRGMRYNAENALFNGHRIFGYKVGKDKKYIEDPNTAPIVPRIFYDYANGKPLKEIADELNSQGIRTVNGARFNVENLRKILKNDKYTGLYHYDDIAIPGGMPQLVSQELYDKVQAQFALNKRGGRPATGDEEDEEPRYWLTGKLYCAKCKSPMHGVYGSGKSHRYYYYACNEQRKHKCSKKPVKKDWIESTVIDLLRMLLNKDDNALVLIENAIREYKKNSNDKAYLNSLEAELKEVQRKLDNMIKAIEDGVYTETTRSRLIELEERRDALDQAIMVEQAKNELFQDVGFGELYKRYLDADLDNPELRDELLDYFVDKIYIDDDGKLSFVLKLYDKDEVELQEVSEDEIFNFVGVEVFDNFGLCSTTLEVLIFKASSFFIFKRL